MSKTLFVEFRDNGFWACDITSSVFLKYLLEAAAETATASTQGWLVEAINRWRLNAVISDFGIHLDGDWTQSQIDVVVECCLASTKAIRQRESIAAVEIESWPVFGDHRISTRGRERISAECVARLGEAIASLLENKLPEPPDRHWWFFGLDDDVVTIKRNSD